MLLPHPSDVQQLLLVLMMENVPRHGLAGTHFLSLHVIPNIKVSRLYAKDFLLRRQAEPYFNSHCSQLLVDCVVPAVQIPVAQSVCKVCSKAVWSLIVLYGM